MWVFINHTVHVSVQTLTFNSAPCCLLLCRTSSCRLSLQPRWRRTLWASRRWRCRRRPARSRRWRASRTRRRTITWTSEPVRPETSCARSNWTRPGLLSQQGLTLPNLCTCLKENERYMSLQLSFPSHALPNWKKCSIVIACHVTDGALDGRLQSHSMSVNLCHLCISHFSLWSSPALWIWQQRLLAFTAFQSRVYASIFFYFYVVCYLYLRAAAKPENRSIWGLHLLSSIISFLAWEDASHLYTIYYNEHKGDIRTIGCIHPWSHTASQPVADWKCLHLTFGMFFSWHSTVCYFCTHCISCNILSDIYIYFSFLRCAFVAKRNSSYQEDVLSPALIWMRGFSCYELAFVHIIMSQSKYLSNVFGFNASSVKSRPHQETWH